MFILKPKLKYFFNRLRTIKQKGSFAQNFSYTLSGNVFGILFTALAAPILARIYPPESFGSFSIYTAIIINVSSFSLLSYHIALILPKEEEEFKNLLRLIFLLVVLISILFLGIISLFSKSIFILFSIQNIGNYIYFLAPVILLTGFSSILSQWLTRDKEFKKLSIVNSATVMTSKLSALLLGYLFNGNVSGFIIGDALGKTIATFVLIENKLRLIIREFFTKWNFKNISTIAKVYKRYPLMVLPGEYINLISGQLPIYMISIYYGNKELGYFAFAASILDVPLNLLGNAVRPVFYQKATSIYQDNSNKLGVITLDLFKYLFLLGIIPFSILTVFGDLIFGFIFGPQWIKAGFFAGILGYYYIFRLISSPISTVLWVIKKENVFLYFQIFLFVTRLMSLLVGIYIYNDLIDTIICFSIANTLNYLMLTFYILKELNLNHITILTKTILVMLSVFILLYLLRFGLDKFI